MLIYINVQTLPIIETRRNIPLLINQTRRNIILLRKTTRRKIILLRNETRRNITLKTDIGFKSKNIVLTCSMLS